MDMAEEMIGKLLESSGVTSVYGRPIKQGDVTIVPAAEVLAGIGFGAGFGHGPITDVEEGTSTTGGGEGGGGGGKTLSRPVAVVVATTEGVHVEPVFDWTKIYMAAITAAGFMLAMLLRLMSPRKALKELKGK
jgi:uncharacterized spore protein YtfJ